MQCLLSLALASEAICRLLGATSDWFQRRGLCFFRNAVLETASEAWASLLWVLELLAGPGNARVLGAGQGLRLTLVVVFVIDHDKPLR